MEALIIHNFRKLTFNLSKRSDRCICSDRQEFWILLARRIRV